MILVAPVLLWSWHLKKALSLEETEMKGYYEKPTRRRSVKEDNMDNTQMTLTLASLLGPDQYKAFLGCFREIPSTAAECPRRWLAQF